MSADIIETYQGKEPYIFISYAHKDSGRVIPLIRGLWQQGFRVWYDSGIEAGTEWPEYIAERLMNSGCVVAFLSRSSIDSPNCRQEIRFAIELRKELLIVYLEDLELTPGMRMQLNSLQAMFRNRSGSDASFLEQLANARLLAPCLGSQPRQSSPAVGMSGEALRWLERAQQGDAEAQFMLGECYHCGKGVTKDDTSAFSWFRKAAEQNDRNAQYNLGVMYNSGIGTAPDYAQSAFWFRKAAEQGDTAAQRSLAIQYYYGRGVTQDYAQAVVWFKKAAEQGDADSQFMMGQCCLSGKGIPQDRVAAFGWYQKAADQNQAKAQYSVGWFYYDGIGVSRDYSQAAFWFRKAADQGDAMSQYGMGLCYENGNGVEKNLSEAKKWYMAAKNQGHEDAAKRYAAL